MIPYSTQDISDSDIDAVIQVLRGPWLTQGPHIEAFEEAVRRVTGAEYAIAFSNGTAALHAAAAVSGLGPGDTVYTSPLSFVASANCARFVDASVSFVDIDPDTLNLDLRKVPPRAAGLVAVHFAGLPLDLGLMKHRPRVVIEDAAHALGATGPDGPVGNCARSDLCVFSFHPVKAVTSGEGGVVTTNSARLSASLKRFRHHGICPQPSKDGPWYYEVDSLGFNYRITDLQAALGTSQMARLDQFIIGRNRLADAYRRNLAGLPIELPPAAPEGSLHAYHLFAIRTADRKHIYEVLRQQGIGVQVHYVPIHWHPIYARLGHSRGSYPLAEAAYERLLSLPLFPSLSQADQEYVVDNLRAVLID